MAFDGIPEDWGGGSSIPYKLEVFEGQFLVGDALFQRQEGTNFYVAEALLTRTCTPTHMQIRNKALAVVATTQPPIRITHSEGDKYKFIIEVAGEDIGYAVTEVEASTSSDPFFLDEQRTSPPTVDEIIEEFFDGKKPDDFNLWVQEPFQVIDSDEEDDSDDSEQRTDQP